MVQNRIMNDLLILSLLMVAEKVSNKIMDYFRSIEDYSGFLISKFNVPFFYI